MELIKLVFQLLLGFIIVCNVLSDLHLKPIFQPPQLLDQQLVLNFLLVDIALLAPLLHVIINELVGLLLVNLLDLKVKIILLFLEFELLLLEHAVYSLVLRNVCLLVVLLLPVVPLDLIPLLHSNTNVFIIL